MGTSLGGILAMVAACVIWGLSPLFYALLNDVPALELMAHRSVWSALVFAAFIALTRRLGAWRETMVRPGAWRGILAAALLIAVNWFGFIYAIQTERTLETALGYFIFPLVAVAFGRLFFAETLGRARAFAVGLAAMAVTLLSVGSGVVPVLGLFLAVTFALYGVVKKKSRVGPVMSVTSEAAILAPFAIFGLGLHHVVDPNAAFGSGFTTTALLIASGVVTALPLILFSAATRRVGLGTLGILQFINPMMQFLIATLIFQEIFTLWHAIAFGLIWLAILVFAVNGWAQDRASRRAAKSASVSATGV